MPCERAVNVNTKLFIWRNLISGYIVNDCWTVITNWLLLKDHLFLWLQKSRGAESLVGWWGEMRLWCEQPGCCLPVNCRFVARPPRVCPRRYAALCWGGSNTADHKNNTNKIIRKAISVIGLTQDSLEVTVEKRTRAKLKTVLYFEGHPSHSVFNGLRSSFSEWWEMPRCSTEQLTRSLVPAAVRFINGHFQMWFRFIAPFTCYSCSGWMVCLVQT